MKITCAFQYELYVDETRRAALSRNAGCRRFVFNKALGIQNERKSKGEKLLTYKELAHELVLWKKQPETAFLREAMAQPLQQALLDLDRAISDSFRPKSDPAHKGWPKFKAKDIGDGFRVPQFAPEHIDDANGRVKLPKIGWIRYRRTRAIAFECANGTLVPGVVKQIHVKKDCGRWFVIFTVEFEVQAPDMKALDVGIDVGVVHAVATSDGRFYDLDTEKIRSIEKRIAGFLYRKIRCIRQDFHRKTAHALAQEYGCVYVEDLKVKNMTASAKGTVANPGKNVKQKSGLNRAILRTGFYSLRQTIEWQLLKVGGVMIPVDPRGTSITCPHCQSRDKRNRPTQAIFKCVNESCGFEANADVVGALNVLRKGRTGPSAHNKKHIAHVVSVGEQGFRPKDSMPSMGTALEPRDRVVQGIPAL
jgi:transposase, IS605 orfB family